MRGAFYLQILVFLFSVPVIGISQDSFSVILEVDSANINFDNFGFSNNQYYIPINFPDVNLKIKSAIIEFDPQNLYQNIIRDIDSINFGPEPTIIFQDTILALYGKDRSYSKSLRLLFFDRNLRVFQNIEIPTKGFVNNALTNLVIDKNAYLGILIDSLNTRYVGISKLDINGEILWTKYYNVTSIYSFIDKLASNGKDKVYFSCAITKPSFPSQRRAQLTQIDTSGNILWEYIPDEAMSGGAVPPWFAVLSDSTIVMNYSINKDWDDPEDWNRKLYKFVWIDQNGQFIRERYIPHHWKVDAYIADVKGGKQGDYFFTFGRERDIRDPYQSQAVLTKYDDAGDTIWHRSYAHPDFPNENFQYSMVEMEEQDDGSFVLLAKISTARDYNKAWLFTVDNMGCFYTDSCGERLVVSTPTVYIPEERKRATLFPNPVRNQLTIQSSAPFDQLVFYNMAGEEIFVQKMTRTDQYTIHSGDLRPGMYIVHLRHQGQILERLKFVKI